MIVSVFGPCGKVTATASCDTFFDIRNDGEDIITLPMNIQGLPHTHSFWGKYMLVFNCINQNAYDAQIQQHFSALTNRWNEIPHIKDFMPYLKKLIVDNHIQIIGVVSAYCENEGEGKMPYVYQILGEEIRRVNIDNSGNLNYNCICLEKEPILGKLLRKVKLRNGDTWEEIDELRFRYDLFSVTKSIDFCEFVVKTNFFLNNINTVMYNRPMCADITIVTPDSVDTLQKNI